MICTNGEEIRHSDPHRHKYGSAMAELLDHLNPDEETGSVDWHGHVGRFGKRLLHSDDQGFVDVERYTSEAEAIERFQAIDTEYGEWLGDDDEPTMHLTLTLVSHGVVPNALDGNSPMNHYTATLTDGDGDTLSVPFYTGTGWDREPQIGDVLSCLASDLSFSDPADAEDAGLTIPQWEALKAQNARVAAFLGEYIDAFMERSEEWEELTGTEATLS
jgi:hypothetical protein